MKIIINKANLPEHPEHFLRRAGYAFHRDDRMNKESFVRRLGNHFYPRLHMYVEYQGDKIIFDLHLDQKQASYQGARMHNAEHGGEVVESEIRRLKSLIMQNINSHNASIAADTIQNKELVDKIGGERDYTKGQPKKEKKSWWKRLLS